MLKEFTLKNFVLIEKATLGFEGGLNIISGETGAGKSLVATALSIVLGRSRFLTSHIRKGADASSLRAIFSFDKKVFSAICEASGLNEDSAKADSFVIEREMTSDGRGKASICGKALSVSKLKEIGHYLFDISAQDEHSFIREESHQRSLLDSFSKADIEVKEAGDIFRKLSNVVERIKGGEAARREKKALLEIVRHEIEELELLSVDDVAAENIDEKIDLLENASQLQAFCASAVESLYEADNSVAGVVGGIAREASEFEGFSQDVREASELLNGINGAVDDCVRLLRDCEEKSESNPEELEQLIERKHSLQDCARKHSCEISELSEKLSELRRREEDLSAWEEEEENLQPKAEKLAADFIAASEKLHAKRKTGAEKLKKEVKRSLKLLGMEQADFRIEINPLLPENPSPEDIVGSANMSGADEVIYTIKPNKGEPWGCVADIASGGETTRIMLAVKAALIGVNPCEVLFFDEIEAGVGGRVAEAVARQLELLAASRQVIAITHLPQIAGYGNNHLCVRKYTEKGRTVTSVEKLEGKARINEIANMIRGEKITSATLAQAGEMLQRQ